MSFADFYDGESHAFRQICKFIADGGVTLADVSEFAKEGEARSASNRRTSINVFGEDIERHRQAGRLDDAKSNQKDNEMRTNSEWTNQELAEFSVAQSEWLMRPENRVPTTGPVGDDYEDGDMRCDVDGKLWLLYDGRWHQIVNSISQKEHA